VLPWALPAVVIAVFLVPVSALVPAVVVLALAVGVLLLVTGYVEIQRRRRLERMTGE